MKKIVSILFFIFYAHSFLFCQQIGWVKDSTGFPLSDVTVYYGTEVFYTDIDGKFEFRISPKYDSITFFKTGFLHTTAQYQQNHQYYLQENPLPELDELIIKNKKYQNQFIINPVKKRTNLTFSSLVKSIQGRVFPYDSIYSKTPYIVEISFYAKNIKKDSSTLRVHLMKSDNGKMIYDNIFRTFDVTTHKKKKVSIDLSNYTIPFPEEGLIVCFEWLQLPENQYLQNVRYDNKTTGEKTKKEELFTLPWLYQEETDCTSMPLYYISRDGINFEWKKTSWSEKCKSFDIEIKLSD